MSSRSMASLVEWRRFELSAFMHAVPNSKSGWTMLEQPAYMLAEEAGFAVQDARLLEGYLLKGIGCSLVSLSTMSGPIPTDLFIMYRRRLDRPLLQMPRLEARTSWRS